MKRIPTILGLLLIGITLAKSAFAADIGTQNYRHAFSLIDAGRVLEADVFAAHGHDPALNKVIHALYMAQPGNEADFAEMADFIAHNPDWPDLKGIKAIAEQKIPSSWTPAQTIAWFTSYPPNSSAGFYRYVDALNMSGQAQTAVSVIRTRWAEADFGADELIAFHARFAQFIGENENNARLDRLLWKADRANVRNLFPLLDAEHRELAEARLALATKSPNVDGLITKVPSELQNDSGLLYERLRWHVRNNQDSEAITILHHAPENLVKPEAWWEQRQIMARRMMDKKDYEEAYRLAASHGHLEGRSLAEAEFLCGWLALRFLDEQEDARQHFQILFDNAGTPISRARGAYWLGRTYEAHGDKNMAQQAYETAATLNVTYYGQLAAAKIYESPTISATPEPTIPQNVRNTFNNRDLIRAVERLYAIGEHDRAHSFFLAAVDAAQLRADFAMLTELAYRMERPDFAIEAGKAASKKNMLMAAGGFPLLGRNIPRPPDPAFTHALIRQESMFNPEARSPVGAEGLMQLMPTTAKGVAKKIGIRYKAGMLTDSDYNIRLGTTFVQDQINGFDGSYVLALAGYNAGPHRVREWMAQIGDPRSPNVDAVDWVELIPLHETRNYVQRIIESLQIYRARLAGGQAPLLIDKDLKR